MGGKTGGKENKYLVPEIKLFYLGKNILINTSYQQLFQAPKEVTRKRIKRFILSRVTLLISQLLAKKTVFFSIFF